MSRDKDESVFSKVSGFFGNKEKKEEVFEAKVDKEGIFEGIKNIFFGEKKEEIIDIEAFEVVASDMEIIITERSINTEGKLIELKSTGTVENLEEKGLLDKLSDTASVTVGAVRDTVSIAVSTVVNTASESWDFTTEKLGVAKQATIEFSSSTADSLVHFTKEVGRRYDEIEISPKFYSLINTMDLVLVISSLQLLVEKQRKGSKEFIALSAVIGLLILLERSKEGMKKEMGFVEVNEELSHDLSSLLKSVTFKDMVETAEPILLIIPNGNYILLILKLFV
ncbi:hypothetical protein HX045_05970 [Myroides odoratimimus]|uniref:Uncharacterized protein n=1 Tax=Myroides odoratimimus TaxID=76832 RepID=A0AAI8C6R1_9FLAO|nr:MULTISPECIES: hypothetical protein [Myroides]ALU27132.1 hypothetical protein AS202_13625 [Myroides odoratimimus]APA93155.1 hypothetical protein BK054_13175 [Myroides sp. ZB35]EKB07098.1 hypothetical protein HMPREF9711_00408 [Myroides odoratimimus CCUG 3837]MCA4792253.1 hypothetical protein [Myroides odoratimimus]MCA4806231.1 hypothetical protein [Myroides odoratimimus]